MEFTVSGIVFGAPDYYMSYLSVFRVLFRFLIQISDLSDLCEFFFFFFNHQHW